MRYFVQLRMNVFVTHILVCASPVVSQLVMVNSMPNNFHEFPSDSKGVKSGRFFELFLPRAPVPDAGPAGVYRKQEAGKGRTIAAQGVGRRVDLSVLSHS